MDLSAQIDPLPRDDWFADAIHLSETGTVRVAQALVPAIREALPLERSVPALRD